MSPTPPSPRADLAGALRSHPLPDIAGADKHGRGTTLVVGGSAETPGAVILAGRAALRAGAGRLRVVTDPSVAGATAVAVPEARVGGWDDLGELTEGVDALVLGPGLLLAEDAARLLSTVAEVHEPGRVVVLDALAIAALAQDVHACDVLAGGLALTPNQSELRQVGKGDDLDASAASAARRFGAAVVSFDVVAAPDGETWTDPADVSGLGTSGAGDVLAGLVGGFGSVAGDATTAACWGNAVHRGAARAAASAVAPAGYLASDLVAAVPGVVADLRRRLRAAG